MVALGGATALSRRTERYNGKLEPEPVPARTMRHGNFSRDANYFPPN